MDLFTWIVIFILISILVWLVYEIPLKENFIDMYPGNTLFVEGMYPYYYWGAGPNMVWNNATRSTRYDSYDIRDYPRLYA